MSVGIIITSIISGFFQSLATMMSLLKLINAQNKKDKILSIIILTIYFSISILFIPNQLRFLIFILVLILLIYFILKEKSNKIVFYAFIPILLLSLSEIIISLILVLIGIESTLIVNNYMYNLVANVLISLLVIILINLKIFKTIIKKVESKIYKISHLIKYMFLFLIMLYLLVSKNGLEFILKSNYYLNIVIIIGMLFIFMLIVKNEYKAEKLKEQNQQMLNYVTKYEKIITEQGKTNHEFKNQLMVIKGYAQLNSKKLIEYLDSITKDFNKTTSSYLISQLNKFPDGGIKGLLYYKLSIMEDEKINYEIDVESGVKSKLKKLEIAAYKNITKVLGVLLDNAIEASKKSKEKNVVISVTKDNKEVTFSISNTYKGKIEIEKIGTGYTTKGNGHGYGLRLVNDII